MLTVSCQVSMTYLCIKCAKRSAVLCENKITTYKPNISPLGQFIAQSFHSCAQCDTFFAHYPLLKISQTNHIIFLYNTLEYLHISSKH